MDADRRSASLAVRQWGLISRPQALACGMTRKAIAWRLNSGRWVRVLPNVYRIDGVPESWEQSLCAACLWAGDGSAASHGSAARLWGFNGFNGVNVEISTIRRRRDLHVDVTVHRVSDPLEREIEVLEGIPATSVRRTLLDLAGARHFRTERVLDQALARDLTSLGQLWLLYEEEWTRGRRGIAILRELLAARTPGAAPDDSELEFLMDQIVRQYGLPEPKRQFPIVLSFGTVHVDYCYPASRLIIETDGYAWHSDRATFESDRRRDNELQALGWRVLRFTWAQLRWRPIEVVEMVRWHLESPSGQSTPLYGSA